MRHNYLAATFGTKPEEDRSYENSHKLMITTTVCMISFLVLEIAFYFLYNRKVRVIHCTAGHKGAVADIS